MNCDTEKLRELFNRGLTAGLGDARGKVCIEAAISLACGGDLSASPPCVAEPDRAYSIAINDAAWSSPHARAEALWPLALAQIGTAGKDRTAWAKALVEGTIRRVLPIVLRAVGLRNEAARCEAEGSYTAARAVRAAADYAAAAAAAAAWAAADYAAAAAAAWAAANAAADSAAAAAAAADVAAYAANMVAYAADADAVLRTSVQVALDAYAAMEVTR